VPIVTAPHAERRRSSSSILVDTLAGADQHEPVRFTRANTTPELSKLGRPTPSCFETGITAASWNENRPSGSLLTSSITRTATGAVAAPRSARFPPAGHARRGCWKGQGVRPRAPSISNSVNLFRAHTNFEKGFEYFAGPARRRRPSFQDRRGGSVRSTVAPAVAGDARSGLPSFLYVHTMDPPRPPTRRPPPFAIPGFSPNARILPIIPPHDPRVRRQGASGPRPA